MCVRLGTDASRRGSFRESPWLRADHLCPPVSIHPTEYTLQDSTYLSFTVGPKVDAQPNHLVNGGVRALVQQRRGEGRHREKREAGFEAAVQAGPGEEADRPLPCEEDQAKGQIYRLKDRYRFDGRIERFGDEVPEYLGPEIPFHRGSNLVCMIMLAFCPLSWENQSVEGTYTSLPSG